MYVDSVGKIHTHIYIFQCVCAYIYAYICSVNNANIFEFQKGTEQCGK